MSTSKPVSQRMRDLLAVAKSAGNLNTDIFMFPASVLQSLVAEHDQELTHFLKERIEVGHALGLEGSYHNSAITSEIKKLQVKVGMERFMGTAALGIPYVYSVSQPRKFTTVAIDGTFLSEDAANAFSLKHLKLRTLAPGEKLAEGQCVGCVISPDKHEPGYSLDCLGPETNGPRIETADAAPQPGTPYPGPSAPTGEPVNTCGPKSDLKTDRRTQIVDAMCMTVRHDYGLPPSATFTVESRRALFNQMAQIYNHHVSPILKDLDLLKDQKTILMQNEMEYGIKYLGMRNQITEKLRLKPETPIEVVLDTIQSIQQHAELYRAGKREYLGLRDCVISDAEYERLLKIERGHQADADTARCAEAKNRSLLEQLGLIRAALKRAGVEFPEGVQHIGVTSLANWYMQVQTENKAYEAEQGRLLKKIEALRKIVKYQAPHTPTCTRPATDNCPATKEAPAQVNCSRCGQEGCGQRHGAPHGLPYTASFVPCDCWKATFMAEANKA